MFPFSNKLYKPFTQRRKVFLLLNLVPALLFLFVPGSAGSNHQLEGRTFARYQFCGPTRRKASLTVREKPSCFHPLKSLVMVGIHSQIKVGLIRNHVRFVSI